MSKVYSLSKVSVTITNNTTNKEISISGGAHMMDKVSFRYNSGVFSRTASNDGGSAVSHNADLSGVITISLNQASDSIKDMISFCLECKANPENASCQISVKDSLGNIDVNGIDAFIVNIPDFNYSTSLNTRDFQFTCAQIIDNSING